MKTALLYFDTIIYLRPIQIYYQIFYKIRTGFRKIIGFKYPLFISAKSYSITLKSSIPSNHSYISRENRFQFLNQSQTFSVNKIDWNDEKTYGKLWAYNLNYFDFLNQENIIVEEGLALIRAYIQEGEILKTGFEPYPMSLRGINWIKFLSKNQIQDDEIDAFLMAQYVRLIDNLEYHLMGNHLLENAFSLLFGGYYFRKHSFLKLSCKIFQTEFPEQILEDGGHFERSPMYHQILLFRVLDCLNLVMSNDLNTVIPTKEGTDFQILNQFIKTSKSVSSFVGMTKQIQQILTFYAQKMLNFLQNITFKNGQIPLVNDATKNIAPTTKQLVEYANRLNVYHPHSTTQQLNNSKLSKSGYRKFENDVFELFMDVGDIAPDYQPAHAHCDTLSFVLYVNQKPFIVDTGTSTYENNEVRQLERSTIAHNTVQIGDFEQSEMWSSFRVGKRAKATILMENEREISASHDGYKRYGIIHKRTFMADNQCVTIKDEIIGETKYPQKAYLHFHPDVDLIINENIIQTNFGNVIVTGVLKITESNCNISEELNVTISSKVITLFFSGTLTTTINFQPP